MVQLMETDEIANPAPIGFFCADAVMMRAHTALNCSCRRGLLEVSMADSLAVFLYSSNGGAKRGSQANTSMHQGQVDNTMI
jgi:hypothetical protein